MTIIIDRKIVGGDAVIPPSLFGGKFVSNLLQKQFVSEYSQSITAGTGTPTIVKDDATQEVTITIPAGTTGRAFLAMDAMTFLAGHTYSLDLKITDYVAPNATGDFFISRVSAPTLDFGTVQLAITGLVGDSKQAVIFQPTTTQDITFRIGFGIGGNLTAGAADAKVIIKNIKFEDLSLSGSNIPNEYVEPRQSALILSDYQGYLTTAISGKLTLTKNVKSAEKGLSIAIFGDSYVNDSTEYPEQLKLLTQPRIGVWYQSQISMGVTTAGTRPSVFLAPFQAKMQKLILAGQAPKYVLLQSSLNTVNGTTLATHDAAIATDLAAIKAAAQWAIANGIAPILTTMAAWKTGAGANWITNGVYLAQQKWDNAITGLASELGVSIFSMRQGIEDTAIPYKIAAAYDSGDGTHPNALGSAIIAARLHALLTESASPALVDRTNRDIGEFVHKASATETNGLKLCNAQALSRTVFAALFAEIGTTHGVGNGTTTFNVPDMRGRVLGGAGQGTFVSSYINTAVDTATNAIAVAANASLYTGVAAVLTTSGGAPAGLTAGETYYVIRDSSTSIKLATTAANAINGTAIDITTQGTGTHTLTVTYTDRVVGSVAGEESHGLTITEMASHTHTVETVQTATTNAFGGNDIRGNSTTKTSSATGGSTTHNIMQPTSFAGYWFIYTGVL